MSKAEALGVPTAVESMRTLMAAGRGDDMVALARWVAAELPHGLPPDVSRMVHRAAPGLLELVTFPGEFSFSADQYLSAVAQGGLRALSDGAQRRAFRRFVRRMGRRAWEIANGHV